MTIVAGGQGPEGGLALAGRLTFHHHGLALKEDSEALRFVELLGYRTGALVHDPLQDVRLRLCSHATLPAIEFVMPGDRPGPLDAIVRRHDQLLYHTCYEVADRNAVLDSFELSNLRTIEVLAPTPAVLFGGRKVSFHSVMGFGLIELLDLE